MRFSIPNAVKSTVFAAALATTGFAADGVAPGAAATTNEGALIEQPLFQVPDQERAQAAIEAGKRLFPTSKKAKNVILFVGDGMGVSTVTAARIYAGQKRGQSGEENSLSFEKLPHLSLSKVYNTNQQTPDSAGTMTAMMSGVKTKAGVIGVNQNVTRGDASSVAGNELFTLIEIAELVGKSTGVVSTARLTHATPAACYSHSPERNWESDRDLSDKAKAADFPDIARQLIEFPFGDGLEVAMGGGRRAFLPASVTDGEGATGRRTDGRDLTQEWLDSYSRSAYVWNKDGFDGLNTANTDHLLALFESSHMEYEYDRPGDAGGEPSIAEMTDKALDILSKNSKGYFLMVEAGRIDHAHHEGNAFRALEDTVAFADAVQAAMDRVDLSETLIIVTADHSHVFTIGGYPTRGNNILGKVITNDSAGNPQDAYATDANGVPYTTLGYHNGPGYIGGVRADFDNAVEADYLQEAAVPMGSETHSAEDVAIFAGGPNAELFQGVVEQSMIFHVMSGALLSR